MPLDTADEWLRADAERRGMTLSEYEQAFGVRFDGGPGEKRALYHEVTAGLLAPRDNDLAQSFERRRLAHFPHRGRRPRAIRRRAA